MKDQENIFLDEHERQRHIELVKAEIGVSQAYSSYRFASQCNFKLSNEIDKLNAIIALKDEQFKHPQAMKEKYLRTISHQKRELQEYKDEKLLLQKKINDIEKEFTKQKQQLQAHIERLSLKLEQLQTKLAIKTDLQQELEESVKAIKRGETNAIYQEDSIAIIHKRRYSELIEKELQLEQVLPVSPSRLAICFKNKDRKMLDLINHVAGQLQLEANTHNIAEFCYYLLLNIDREPTSSFDTVRKEQELTV